MEEDDRRSGADVKGRVAVTVILVRKYVLRKGLAAARSTSWRGTHSGLFVSLVRVVRRNPKLATQAGNISSAVRVGFVLRVVGSFRSNFSRSDESPDILRCLDVLSRLFSCGFQDCPFAVLRRLGARWM